MALITNGLEVCVSGRPDLSHRRSSVAMLPSQLHISKLDDDDERLVASRGAHFSILFSSEIAFRCFERPISTFDFKGPFLGTMEEVSGRWAVDSGTLAHAISEFRLVFSVAPDEHLFRLEIAGELVSMRQTFDYWQSPEALANFTIEASFPLAEAATLFLADRAVVQKRIDEALAWLTDGKIER